HLAIEANPCQNLDRSVAGQAAELLDHRRPSPRAYTPHSCRRGVIAYQPPPPPPPPPPPEKPPLLEKPDDELFGVGSEAVKLLDSDPARLTCLVPILAGQKSAP